MMQRGDQLNYLNGLRGLMVVVVVLCHFVLAFFPAIYYGPAQSAHFQVERWIYNSPLTIFVAGQFAVCVFFVMSGFVLSYKYFLKPESDVATRGALRRYFRLMPAVMVSSALASALIAAGWMMNLPAAALTGSDLWLVHSWSGHPGLFDTLKFGLYDVFFTGENVMTYNNVLWTMKVEFLGSLLVFAVLALFGRLRRRWIIYIILSVLLYNSYYLGFVLGMALCDLMVAASRTKHPLGRPIFGWAAVAQGLSIGALNVFHPAHEQYRPFFFISGAALLLSGILLIPEVRRLLVVRPLLYLGRVSFAIYLLHLSILASVGCGVFLRLYPIIGYKAGFLLSFVSSIVITLILSELLTRYVDEPAIRFSGLLIRRVFGDKAPTPSGSLAGTTAAPAAPAAPRTLPAVSHIDYPSQIA